MLQINNSRYTLKYMYIAYKIDFFLKFKAEKYSNKNK